MGKHKMVKMWSPDPGHQVSWDGETYFADKDGFVEVPGLAVADLVAHGLETLKGKADREKREREEREALLSTHISKPDTGVPQEEFSALVAKMNAMAEEHKAVVAKLDAVSAELMATKKAKK